MGVARPNAKTNRLRLAIDALVEQGNAQRGGGRGARRVGSAGSARRAAAAISGLE